ncbi:MAG TPA: hypothetical protein DCP91_05180 [Eggerthellaceae bacterium]|nr:hypothetical protein [Eggerthellaceae bacterium]
MSDELYKPLPDVDAYLERMGLDSARRPSADFLDELISAHQHAVPFEDLDVFDRHAPIPLGVEQLFDKVVKRRRGGYCFELNGLFAALLRALGFEVQPCMGRVLMRPNPYPLVTHRANIVTIDGSRFLADVGFGGPMPAFAPVIEDGATRTLGGQTFTLHVHDAYWWDVGYRGTKDDERIVMRFCQMPVEEHDFIPLSFYQAQNEQSAFRLHRMVNVKTETGAYDIRDTTFTEFSRAGAMSFEVESEEALDALLAEKFGIVDWR